MRVQAGGSDSAGVSPSQPVCCFLPLLAADHIPGKELWEGRGELELECWCAMPRVVAGVSLRGDRPVLEDGAGRRSSWTWGPCESWEQVSRRGRCQLTCCPHILPFPGLLCLLSLTLLCFLLLGSTNQPISPISISLGMRRFGDV